MYKYLVSFYALTRMERAEKLKWWQFWKKPRIIAYEDWVRYAMPINEEEKTLLLLPDRGCLAPSWTLLYRALAGADAGNVKQVQLEELITGAGYVKNEYVSPETKE